MKRTGSDTEKKAAWVLVNVGTPDSPSTASVRRYLRQFLNDPKVIDLPWLARKLLVNLVIVPFRAPRSAKKYRQIWTPDGSPLLFHMNALVKKLQQLAGDRADVFGVMRYGNPSLEALVKELKNSGYRSVTYLPLYPQVADSTTGSVEQVVASGFSKTESQGMKIVGAANEENPVISLSSPDSKLPVRFIRQFYNHPAFIEVFAGNILRYDPGSFDHVLFSYHGLPLRQIRKCHPAQPVEQCTCATGMPSHGTNCYRAQCYATTRLLAAKAGIPAGSCSTAFQSRLSRNWMSPFTDDRLKELAKAGKRRVLVVPASFVADCLETTLEIGMEYRELFLESGGKELVMVESLNSSDRWAEGVTAMLSQ
ncbi:MAG: ferrochelatase [Bacteroidales bacterium]|nr:ferrochelatase [Bacteroidales bacterium]